nr:biosynthetic peptidoglycan transglycosylase [Schlegelella koreensis]
MADVVAAFGDALGDLRHARIAGRAGVEIRVALPSGRFAIEPRLEGLGVAGLGAEALLGAAPAPACGRPAARALRPTSWVARAVLAAEDQRFHEHPGYDLDEMSAAWSGVAEPDERRRGASTITQQLAKLLYTGDDRTMARKLRELLHASDLERALGKARILELYLAIAPWGDRQCGAEAAAWHYFGRPAAALDAAEAVWLASLLRNPERELVRWSGAAPPTTRLAAIAHGMRPLGRAARARLAGEAARFVPPPVVLARRGDPDPPSVRAAMSR